jgi:hypothetical protein
MASIAPEDWFGMLAGTHPVLWCQEQTPLVILFASTYLSGSVVDTEKTA